MLASLLTLMVLAATGAPPVAGAATPGNAALPTPIPVSTLAPITVHQLTLADQYPWLITAIQVLFLAATIGVIALMSIQTTKTEGLSGSIGGRAEAAYRGRLGFEQQITRITSVVAVSWIVLAVVYYWITR